MANFGLNSPNLPFSSPNSPNLPFSYPPLAQNLILFTSFFLYLTFPLLPNFVLFSAPYFTPQAIFFTSSLAYFVPVYQTLPLFPYIILGCAHIPYSALYSAPYYVYIYFILHFMYHCMSQFTLHTMHILYHTMCQCTILFQFPFTILRLHLPLSELCVPYHISNYNILPLLCHILFLIIVQEGLGGLRPPFFLLLPRARKPFRLPRPCSL